MDSGWWGFFEPSGHPQFARYGSLIFTVAEDYRLHFDHSPSSFEALDYTHIWVVGSKGKKQWVDPPVGTDQVRQWRLQIWEAGLYARFLGIPGGGCGPP